MTKAYKMTVYVIDLNYDFGSKDAVKQAVKNCDADFTTITDIQEVEIGEWDDEHPLNYGVRSPWGDYFK